MCPRMTPLIKYIVVDADTIKLQSGCHLRQADSLGGDLHWGGLRGLGSGTLPGGTLVGFWSGLILVSVGCLARTGLLCRTLGTRLLWGTLGTRLLWGTLGTRLLWGTLGNRLLRGNGLLRAFGWRERRTFVDLTALSFSRCYASHVWLFNLHAGQALRKLIAQRCIGLHGHWS